jgi:NAD(P)-dependent dehydrogenase (short-subunit alcohol dehydrogenase family)
MQTLENKTVIITGGSRGIGRVIALRLAKEKANVVIASRTKSMLESTENELLKINKKVLAINADVSKYEDVKRIVNDTIQKFGNVHDLVNNAAIMTHKSVKDFSIDEWKKVIEVNLFGTFMMCKEVLPYMERLSSTTGGTIVNICSTSGKRGYEGGSAYSASKFALTGFSESLFKEVRNKNIRVVAIYPSHVDTDVKDESKLKEIGKGVYMRAEDVADTIILSMKLPQRALLKEVEIWGTNP